LKVLEQIQKIDLEVSAIEQEQKEYEERIETITASITGMEEEIEALSSETETLENLRRDVEERIRQSSEKVTRDERRLGEIKTPREMKALNKEINSANKAKKLGEEELERLAARAGELGDRLDQKRTGIEGKNEEVAGLLAEFEQKKASWNQAVAGKLRSRDEIKATIEPGVLRKYELIRSRRGGMAMVPVENETCQGCYIHIPPQVYIQLKKGVDEIITCPHCHRILYVEDQAATEAV